MNGKLAGLVGIFAAATLTLGIGVSVQSSVPGSSAGHHVTAEGRGPAVITPTTPAVAGEGRGPAVSAP